MLQGLIDKSTQFAILEQLPPAYFYTLRGEFRVDGMGESLRRIACRRLVVRTDRAGAQCSGAEEGQSKNSASFQRNE